MDKFVPTCNGEQVTDDNPYEKILSNAVMTLADLLACYPKESTRIDPRAWLHLQVYMPKGEDGKPIPDSWAAAEVKAEEATAEQVRIDPNFQRGRDAYKQGFGLSDVWGQTTTTHHRSVDAWQAGWLLEHDLKNTFKQIKAETLHPDSL